VDTINYIGWKKECFLNKTQSPDNVVLYFNDYNTVYSNSDGLVFRVCIFTSIILFILFIYAPIYKMTDNTPYFYVLIINSFFMMVTVGKIMSNISISWKILFGSPHEAYNVENCSDMHTNFKFLELKQTFYSIMCYDTSLFFSQFINWTIPLYILVVLYIREDEDESSNKNIL